MPYLLLSTYLATLSIPTAQGSSCPDHFLASPTGDVRVGASIMLEHLPCGHVRNIPRPGLTQTETEASLAELGRQDLIYRRLRGVRGVVQPVEYFQGQGIVLPHLLNGRLRTYLELKEDDIPATKRLKWAVAVADTLHALHSRGVVHGALNPDNISLDDHLAPFFMGFSDAILIDDGDGDDDDGSTYSAFVARAASPVREDLFALGSTIYEIMTSVEPHDELYEEDAMFLLRQGRFPPLNHLPCGEVIRRCWSAQVTSAQDVRVALAECFRL